MRVTMSAVPLAVLAMLSFDSRVAYALALPALAVGIWCGIQMYGKLDDAAFRRVILLLLLLLASGLSLVVPTALRSATGLLSSRSGVYNAAAFDTENAKQSLRALLTARHAEASRSTHS